MPQRDPFYLLIGGMPRLKHVAMPVCRRKLDTVLRLLTEELNWRLIRSANLDEAGVDRVAFVADSMTGVQVQLTDSRQDSKIYGILSGSHICVAVDGPESASKLFLEILSARNIAGGATREKWGDSPSKWAVIAPTIGLTFEFTS